ncbi:hypothetical protein Tco_1495751 [Tanacetum coccineum]
MVNGERQIQALIDKKKVVITESSIRSDLHLEDAGETDCLPTATIFEELARIGAKSTAWNEFSSTMASLIICLATNQNFNLSKYIFDAMVKHLDGGGLDSCIPADSLQTPITTQPSSSRTQKKQFRRKQRKDTAVAQEETQQDDSVPTPSNDPPLSEETPEVGKEKEIKNYRFEKTKESCIEDIDKDADISLVDETQGRSDDADMFDTDDLYGDQVVVYNNPKFSSM